VIGSGSYSELPRSARRRLFLRALFGPTLSTGVLFVLYFGLPLNRAFTVQTVVLLIIGLLVFAGLIAVQTRAISRSRYPRVTAITAMAFSIPLFVLLFATAYFLLEHSDQTAFTQPMTRLDSLYFTVTVLSTVGFGDIAAHSELARGITTVQMIADLVLIGLVVRVFLGAVQTGLSGGTAKKSDS
jgi:voltage-gated potassium channel